ncbi:hypothetical protein Tbd_1488 [Thiobacillus denitrificans ATCC 25259]|uniref:Transmembrane protein n=1 Tax=Thiobacillus denitrificans (strain ATCC 25259 / T1) TaxID=292415 RepID=Q3SIT4_THIDA|nr:hypothetical protein [Thiobacillus denitrificans]AAZ97441.1 hypothetical protein Tbd_1488 [Thiobacillus denitrificans ATCC 25259]
MLVKQPETVDEPASTVAHETKPLDGTPSAQAVAHCLRDYVAAHDDGSKAFRLLAALAKETLDQLKKNGGGKIGTKAIYLAAQIDTETDKATRWVSEAWKAWEGKRDERLSGLQDFAANYGLNVYPWPEKRGDGKGGAGRSSLYAVEVRPLVRGPALATPNADIHYIRETTPKPVWWARRFFSGEFHLTGWRKALFVTPAIVSLIFAVVVILAVWLTLSHQQAIPTNRILVLVTSAALIGVVAWRMVMAVGRLGDKRITMAPDILIGFHEYGVQLELTRLDTAPCSASRLGLVRYAATCPVCNAKVQVESGGREFHGRLVGRCQESPDEHVFSFDRVTRTGTNLRFEYRV